MLFVECCLLNVACLRFVVARCLLFIVALSCVLLFVDCWMVVARFVVRCLWFVCLFVMCVVCCWLCVVRVVVVCCLLRVVVSCSLVAVGCCSLVVVRVWIYCLAMVGCLLSFAICC